MRDVLTEHRITIFTHVGACTRVTLWGAPLRCFAATRPNVFADMFVTIDTFHINEFDASNPTTVTTHNM